jgi:hypothetical protein
MEPISSFFSEIWIRKKRDILGFFTVDRVWHARGERNVSNSGHKRY